MNNQPFRDILDFSLSYDLLRDRPATDFATVARGAAQNETWRDTTSETLWKILDACGKDIHEIVSDSAIDYVRNLSDVNTAFVPSLCSMASMLKYEVGSLADLYNLFPPSLQMMVDVFSIDREYLFGGESPILSIPYVRKLMETMKVSLLRMTGRTEEEDVALEDVFKEVKINSHRVNAEQYREIVKSCFYDYIVNILASEYSSVDHTKLIDNLLFKELQEYTRYDSVPRETVIDNMISGRARHPLDLEGTVGSAILLDPDLQLLTSASSLAEQVAALIRELNLPVSFNPWVIADQIYEHGLSPNNALTVNEKKVVEIILNAHNKERFDYAAGCYKLGDIESRFGYYKEWELIKNIKAFQILYNLNVQTVSFDLTTLNLLNLSKLNDDEISVLDFYDYAEKDWVYDENEAATVEVDSAGVGNPFVPTPIGIADRRRPTFVPRVGSMGKQIRNRVGYDYELNYTTEDNEEFIGEKGRGGRGYSLNEIKADDVLETVAEKLTQLVFSIHAIRNEMKRQAQFNAMRGTGSLLAHSINDFLLTKYPTDQFDVIPRWSDEKAYNPQIQAIMDDEELSAKKRLAALRELQARIEENVHLFRNYTNVEIIEYMDTTEYFNIHPSGLYTNDDALLSTRYWETLSKSITDRDRLQIGVMSPNEIRTFYREKMSIGSLHSAAEVEDDIEEFLISLYESGATDTYYDEEKQEYVHPINDVTNEDNLFVYNDPADRIKVQNNLDIMDKKREQFLRYSSDTDLPSTTRVRNGSGQIIESFNWKNSTYASVMLHPFLYTFQLWNPLVNIIINAVSEYVTSDLEISLTVKKIFDELYGLYGESKDFWKYNILDFSGYMTRYEHEKHDKTNAAGEVSPLTGYDGLFYPSAIQEFVEAYVRSRNDLTAYQMWKAWQDVDGSTKPDGRWAAYENILEYPVSSVLVPLIVRKERIKKTGEIKKYPPKSIFISVVHEKDRQDYYNDMASQTALIDAKLAHLTNAPTESLQQIIASIYWQIEFAGIPENKTLVEIKDTAPYMTFYGRWFAHLGYSDERCKHIAKQLWYWRDRIVEMAYNRYDVHNYNLDLGNNSMFLVDTFANEVDYTAPHTLPYTEVEYLESTAAGKQWIDTGLTITGDYTVSVTLAFTSNNSANECIWCAREITLSNTVQNTFTLFKMVNTTQNKKTYKQGRFDHGATAQNTAFTDATWDWTAKHEYKAVKNTLYIDGVSKATTTSSTTTFTSGSNVFLLASQNVAASDQMTNFAKAKLYGAKIIDDKGKTVRDFVPVRVGTVGYLLDKISGRLFGSKGEQEFSCEQIPDIPTQPQWALEAMDRALQATNDYVNRNININQNTTAGLCYVPTQRPKELWIRWNAEPIAMPAFDVWWDNLNLPERAFNELTPETSPLGSSGHLEEFGQIKFKDSSTNDKISDIIERFAATYVFDGTRSVMHRGNKAPIFYHFEQNADVLVFAAWDRAPRGVLEGFDRTHLCPIHVLCKEVQTTEGEYRFERLLSDTPALDFIEDDVDKSYVSAPYIFSQNRGTILLPKYKIHALSEDIPGATEGADNVPESAETLRSQIIYIGFVELVCQMMTTASYETNKRVMQYDPRPISINTSNLFADSVLISKGTNVLFSMNGERIGFAFLGNLTQRAWYTVSKTLGNSCTRYMADSDPVEKIALLRKKFFKVKGQQDTDANKPVGVYADLRIAGDADDESKNLWNSFDRNDKFLCVVQYNKDFKAATWGLQAYENNDAFSSRLLNLVSDASYIPEFAYQSPHDFGRFPEISGTNRLHQATYFNQKDHWAIQLLGLESKMLSRLCKIGEDLIVRDETEQVDTYINPGQVVDAIYRVWEQSELRDGETGIQRIYNPRLVFAECDEEDKREHKQKVTSWVERWILSEKGKETFLKRNLTILRCAPKTGDILNEKNWVLKTTTIRELMDDLQHQDSRGFMQLPLDDYWTEALSNGGKTISSTSHILVGTQDPFRYSVDADWACRWDPDGEGPPEACRTLRSPAYLLQYGNGIPGVRKCELRIIMRQRTATDCTDPDMPKIEVAPYVAEIEVRFYQHDDEVEDRIERDGRKDINTYMDSMSAIQARTLMMTVSEDEIEHLMDYHMLTHHNDIFYNIPHNDQDDILRADLSPHAEGKRYFRCPQCQYVYDTDKGAPYVENSEVSTASVGSTGSISFQLDNITSDSVQVYWGVEEVPVDTVVSVAYAPAAGGDTVAQRITVLTTTTQSGTVTQSGIFKLSGLQAATRYNVRVYCTLADATIVYCTARLIGTAIVPGTPFASLPTDWTCPYCSARFKRSTLEKAQAFSTSKVYQVGDVCTKDGVIYRCVQKHSAGKWDATQFELIINEFTEVVDPPIYQKSSTRGLWEFDIKEDGTKYLKAQKPPRNFLDYLYIYEGSTAFKINEQSTKFGFAWEHPILELDKMLYNFRRNQVDLNCLLPWATYVTQEHNPDQPHISSLTMPTGMGRDFRGQESGPNGRSLGTSDIATLGLLTPDILKQAPAPFDILFWIDSSISMDEEKRRLKESMQDLCNLIFERNPANRVGIIQFTTQLFDLDTIQDNQVYQCVFTSNPTKIQTTINELHTGDKGWGNEHLWSAVMAVRWAERKWNPCWRENSQKLLIIISDETVDMYTGVAHKLCVAYCQDDRGNKYRPQTPADFDSATWIYTDLRIENTTQAWWQFDTGGYEAAYKFSTGEWATRWTTWDAVPVDAPNGWDDWQPPNRKKPISWPEMCGRDKNPTNLNTVTNEKIGVSADRTPQKFQEEMNSRGIQVHYVDTQAKTGYNAVRRIRWIDTYVYRMQKDFMDGIKAGGYTYSVEPDKLANTLIGIFESQLTQAIEPEWHYRLPTTRAPQEYLVKDSDTVSDVLRALVNDGYSLHAWEDGDGQAGSIMTIDLSDEDFDPVYKIYANYEKVADLDNPRGYHFNLFFNIQNLFKPPFEYMSSVTHQPAPLLPQHSYLWLDGTTPNAGGLLTLYAQLKWLVDDIAVSTKLVPLVTYDIHNISDDKPKFFMKRVSSFDGQDDLHPHIVIKFEDVWLRSQDVPVDSDYCLTQNIHVVQACTIHYNNIATSNASRLRSLNFTIVENEINVGPIPYIDIGETETFYKHPGKVEPAFAHIKFPPEESMRAYPMRFNHSYSSFTGKENQQAWRVSYTYQDVGYTNEDIYLCWVIPAGTNIVQAILKMGCLVEDTALNCRAIMKDQRSAVVTAIPGHIYIDNISDGKKYLGVEHDKHLNRYGRVLTKVSTKIGAQTQHHYNQSLLLFNRT